MSGQFMNTYNSSGIDREMDQTANTNERQHPLLSLPPPPNSQSLLSAKGHEDSRGAVGAMHLPTNGQAGSSPSSGAGLGVPPPPSSYSYTGTYQYQGQRPIPPTAATPEQEGIGRGGQPSVTAPRRFKAYPPPSYVWDLGNFRQRGPMGVFVCPPDWWHFLILWALAIIPCVVFLAGVRSSGDITSLVVVPVLLVSAMSCMLLASTCDPGIYRKRVVTDRDRDRIRRQQIIKENALRAKRGLPLLPLDNDGSVVVHITHTHSPAPPLFSTSAAVRAPTQGNTGAGSAALISGGGQTNVGGVDYGASSPVGTRSEANAAEDDNEESDEDHPYRLDLSRITYLPVSGSNKDKYKVECTMCTACGIMRNPRVGHCFTCNVCVDDFDHHCGVVGSCVGRRTFRFFAGILFFTSVLSIYVGVRSILVLATDVDFDDDMKTNGGRFRVIAAIGLLIACLIASCSTAPMACIYVRFACLNTTQKQESNSFRRVVVQGVDTDGNNIVTNPHSSGYCYDFWMRFFGPLGSSRADPWHSKGKLHSTPG